LPAPTPKFALTLHGILGNKHRTDRAKGVESFSQQPLLPIPFHLPISRADVMRHCVTGHAIKCAFFLQQHDLTRERQNQPRASASNVVLQHIQWRVDLRTSTFFASLPITTASSTSQSTESDSFGKTMLSPSPAQYPAAF